MKLAIRSIFLASCTVLFMLQLGAAQVVPQLTPFSADMQISSTRGNGGARDVSGKMYVGHGAMRMDMQGEGPGGIVITTFATKTVDILMPQQQMYIEHKAGDMPGRRGPNLSDMKPYDPQNPCASDPDTTCKKVGVEEVNGRTCDHWEITHKDGTVSNIWVDQKLHFPIKSVSEGTTFELSNIKEGEPDASMFQVPAGYRKMALPPMGGMMQGGPPNQ